MTYISLMTKRKLDSVGFSFPDYEEFLNLGMVYAYQDDEYFIGGFCRNDFTETDRRVSENGEWLPDCDQLLRWLQQCSFDVSIQWNNEESRYNISATQVEYGKFEVETMDLAEGLGKIIYKICKKTQGKCRPERAEWGMIVND